MVLAADSMPVTTDTLYLMGSVMAGTAAVIVFMMKGFRDNRALFYRIISLHNREDDDRFQALSDEIWNIHLRNARRDGDRPPQRKTLPRRRYLAEGGDESSDVTDPKMSFT